MIGASDQAVVRPASRLRGELTLPGDKSISHRALLLAALAAGTSRISGAGDGADVRSTAGIVEQLGASVERLAEAAGRVDYRVVSPGADGLRSPAATLDCGNSGTTLRLTAGLLAGLPISAVLDDIVKFAELEDFIDSPVRTYSSGMYTRLAFSVAINTSPDVLLVDEVLAVGDMRFQKKCLDKIREFQAGKKTILFVSHSVDQVADLCDEAIWLHRGNLMAKGDVKAVIEAYKANLSSESERRAIHLPKPMLTKTGTLLEMNVNRWGSLEIEALSLSLLNRQGERTDHIECGEPLTIQVSYFAHRPVDDPIFTLGIYREDGLKCYDTNTESDLVPVGSVEGESMISLTIGSLDLLSGSYYVDVGIYPRDWSYIYDYQWRAYQLFVTSTGGDTGVFRPPHRWKRISNDAGPDVAVVAGLAGEREDREW